MQIAMWSGPRNLSTALMYSFAARGDVTPVDEPFYALYLDQTGAGHPMRDNILASQPRDMSSILAELPPGAPHSYLKLMTHHMVPGIPVVWARSMVNVHLIRHPARVIASYTDRRAGVTAEDLGYTRQAGLFADLPGPVIDSSDIRKTPKAALQMLCAEIGLPWTDGMLSWPAGPKPFDGVWAPHWYSAVHRSTGFDGNEGPLPEVPPEARAVYSEALAIYDAMRAQALRPG